MPQAKPSFKEWAETDHAMDAKCPWCGAEWKRIARGWEIIHATDCAFIAWLEHEDNG